MQVFVQVVFILFVCALLCLAVFCVFIYLFSVLRRHCEEWGKGECGFFSGYKQRSY
jgi:hypothetical protein